MMTILYAVVATIIGLFLLGWAGDRLVAGAAAAAKRFRVSEVFIGIIIVGFGTSLPEVVATATAAFAGNEQLALGNIIGSNIANIGLILAATLILTTRTDPLPHNRLDYLLMVGTLAVFTLTLILYGALTPPIGGLFLGGLIGYAWLSLRQGQKAGKTGQEEGGEDYAQLTTGKMVFFIVAGLVGLILGANLLIDGATTLAVLLGVPEKVIGITLVAVGTSLPELAAAIAATRRGRLGIIVGNILGSNVFNVLAAAGVTSLISPMMGAAFTLDLIIMMLLTIIAAPLFYHRRLVPFLAHGVGLLILYSGYTVWLFI